MSTRLTLLGRVHARHLKRIQTRPGFWKAPENYTAFGTPSCMGAWKCALQQSRSASEYTSKISGGADTIKQPKPKAPLLVFAGLMGCIITWWISGLSIIAVGGCLENAKVVPSYAAGDEKRMQMKKAFEERKAQQAQQAH
mmetsp:Transcript_29877/g.47751  ORF Transcript_29877/g.47751 Transcript_29877/m.47751 type:complete len:140 (-) Transcript_29877:34-453(-)